MEMMKKQLSTNPERVQQKQAWGIPIDNRNN
jgi:hypothetical protein